MNSIKLQQDGKRTPAAPDLYGLFFEDINRAGDGGLYPEMIRNRAFEDSIAPADCTVDEAGYKVTSPGGWNDEFNHGEGLTRYIRENQIEATPIPAWYAENAEMTLDREHVLNENRLTSLRVRFGNKGSIRNAGFVGMGFEQGKIYHFYSFVQADQPVTLRISLEDESGVLDAAELTFAGGTGFARADADLTARRYGQNGWLRIAAEEETVITIGFTSLMPAETYKGHGLRKDLCEKLEALHPAFLRFPGGCIVEGFSMDTVSLFGKSIGPVWERPSQLLCWHYRATKGLGFHEYLQLCEDLGAAALYVCNCGMTCQGRAVQYFEGKEFDLFLQDTLGAIQYALGGPETKWGAVRAAAGHPAPFPLRYLEIGNENHGPGYEERYRAFYDTIHTMYPNLTLIANDHVEENGLPADVVDEHYYDTVESFAENADLFDKRNRKGPKLFLGEVSVVRGFIGNLYGALGEACFLTGIERNQDLVKLLAYAPLFENVHYRAWYPDLILFDQTRSFGIPSYDVWKLFATTRAETMLPAKVETEKIFHPVHGGGALFLPEGTKFRNVRWNGNSASPAHEIYGHVGKAADGCSAGQGVFLAGVPDKEQFEEAALYNNPSLCERDLFVYGDEDAVNGTFEAEILVEEGKIYRIGVYSSRAAAGVYVPDETKPPKPWNVDNVRPYTVEITCDGVKFYEPAFPEDHPFMEPQALPLMGGTWHRFGWKADGRRMQLYVDGEQIGDAAVPAFDALQVSAGENERDGKLIFHIVNMAEEEAEITIDAGCPVESAYELRTVSGRKETENSFTEPDNTAEQRYELAGAAEQFTVRVPALSANALILRKRGASCKTDMPMVE